MKTRQRDAQNSVLGRYVRSLYDKKLASFVEHSRYAIALRAQYPYLAELFGGLVASDVESFGELGELLAYLGAEPRFDIRINGGTYRSDEINRIISAELDALRRARGEIERIYSLTDDPKISELADKMRARVLENIRAFERLSTS